MKKVVSLKLEESKLEEIRKRAKKQGKTVTDVLTEGVFDSERQYYLEQQILDLKKQLTDMAEKYKSATGHKIQTTKRISIPLTNIEYDMINKAAFESGKSKAQFLRGVVVGQNRLPVLT